MVQTRIESGGDPISRAWVRRVRCVALALLLLAPGLALACQCQPRAGSRSEQVRAEYASAGAVFSAQVEGIEHVELHGMRTRMARVRVQQVWKGELQPGASIRVVSDPESGPMYCGFIAEPGMSLMIYAAGGPPYALHVCSLTSALDEADADLPLLQEMAAQVQARDTVQR